MRSRRAARAARALALGALLAGLALAFAAPGLARLHPVRERLRAAAEDSLGRAVHYDDLALRFFPFRLVVEGPVVAARRSPGNLIEAERAVLGLALAALVAGAGPVESIRVEGARLRLMRTAEGFELPPLAFPRLELRAARVVFDDFAVEPVVHWSLEDVDLESRGGRAGAPVAVEASGRPAGGGSLHLAGSVARDGAVDLELRLDGVGLEPAAPYLGVDSRLSGRATGVIAVRGPAAAPGDLKAELDVSEGALRLGDIALRGQLELRAELTLGASGPRGTFELAASEARLVYARGVAQARGDAARLTGRVVPRPDGALGVEDLRLEVRNLDATGRVRSDARPPEDSGA